MPNSSLLNARLNKVFRAVHDKVCPQCGNRSLYFYNGASCGVAPAVAIEEAWHCPNCPFTITEQEVRALGELTVPEWGVPLLEALEEWRRLRG